MQKLQTTYKLTDRINLIVNEEVQADLHICLTENGEPCTGILKHWEYKDALVVELELIVKKLKEFK